MTYILKHSSPVSLKSLPGVSILRFSSYDSPSSGGFSDFEPRRFTFLQYRGRMNTNKLHFSNSKLSGETDALVNNALTLSSTKNTNTGNVATKNMIYDACWNSFFMGTQMKVDVSIFQHWHTDVDNDYQPWKYTTIFRQDSFVACKRAATLLFSSITWIRFYLRLYELLLLKSFDT